MKLLKGLLFACMLVLVSCGPSIKVTDTWKSPEIHSSKSEDFLVMVRTDDLVSRQRFEDEMVAKLTVAGVKAKASYVAYPNTKLNKEYSESETQELIERLKADGYDGVVLTVLKDVKTEVVTQETGGGYYPSYYGGFGPYYGRYYSPYGMGGTYMPSSARTYSSDIYKLETVVYDLMKPIGKQLVAVVTVDVTDPTSTAQIAEPYAQKVVDQFKQD